MILDHPEGSQVQPQVSLRGSWREISDRREARKLQRQRGGMRPQAKEQRQPPGLEEASRGPPRVPLEAVWQHLDSGSQNYERRTFFCFQLPVCDLSRQLQENTDRRPGAPNRETLRCPDPAPGSSLCPQLQASPLATRAELGAPTAPLFAWRRVVQSPVSPPESSSEALSVCFTCSRHLVPSFLCI